VGHGSLLAACWTAEETSIVCPDSEVPTDVQAETGWRALRVAGTLDFALADVLLSLLQPLAEAEIRVLALSTYDTDYVLVRETDLERARNALLSAGHRAK
jgi:hypothetical protein